MVLVREVVVGGHFASDGCICVEWRLHQIGLLKFSIMDFECCGPNGEHESPYGRNTGRVKTRLLFCAHKAVYIFIVFMNAGAEGHIR